MRTEEAQSCSLKFFNYIFLFSSYTTASVGKFRIRLQSLKGAMANTIISELEIIPKKRRKRRNNTRKKKKMTKRGNKHMNQQHQVRLLFISASFVGPQRLHQIQRDALVLKQIQEANLWNNKFQPKRHSDWEGDVSRSIF